MANAINKYNMENREKYGTRKFEVTICVEEMNIEMAEDVIDMLLESAYEKYPSLFRHPNDIECDIMEVN